MIFEGQPGAAQLNGSWVLSTGHVNPWLICKLYDIKSVDIIVKLFYAQV